MAAVIPLLAVDGYITNKEVLMIKLYEHFLASDYSQSNTHIGNIASLKYLLYNYREGNDLRNGIIKTLTAMYSAYFKSVDVLAEVDNKDNSVSLEVDISAIDYDGKTYYLSRAASYIDNNITDFDIKENNLKGN